MECGLDSVYPNGLLMDAVGNAEEGLAISVAEIHILIILNLV